jgi:Flp pilus assembly protein TadD
VALNKARTSIGVKVLIIILIVAFISLFMYSGIAGIFELFKTSSSTTASSSADPLAAINDRGQSTVAALSTLAASQPTSYTAQVNVANAYFDWAQELSSPQAGQSQITTTAMAAAIDKWTQARLAYEAAAKLRKTLDPPVQVDRSIATFYSNDTTTAIKLAREVTVKQPDFAPAWLNLGMFFDSSGKTVFAIAAYTKYVELEPTGQSVTYAKDRLKALGASVPSTTTP